MDWHIKEKELKRYPVGVLIRDRSFSVGREIRDALKAGKRLFLRGWPRGRVVDLDSPTPPVDNMKGGGR